MLLLRLLGSANPNPPGVDGVLFAGDELDGGGVGITWWPVTRSTDGGVLLIGSDVRRGGGCGFWRCFSSTEREHKFYLKVWDAFLTHNWTNLDT